MLQNNEFRSISQFVLCVLIVLSRSIVRARLLPLALEKAPGKKREI